MHMLMTRHRRIVFARVFVTFLIWAIIPAGAVAHPLGNFTINHFARIESGVDRARIRYVVDLAEIPTFQETQKADLDSDGNLTESELNRYLDQVTPGYLAGLKLSDDGAPVALRLTAKSINKLPGAASLFTLRIVYELTAEFATMSVTPRFHFENSNTIDRAGWREIVIAPASGVNVFDSAAYGSGVSDELRAYPEDLLMAPLNERVADWSVTAGPLPTNAKPLTMRDGKPVVAARDRFAELIAAPKLTPGVILLGLLIAFALGGMHAMSPGHGKTIAGAYLAGSRVTAKHAAFLGLMVPITHTIGVFALGLITLFASRYILPEKLYPILSFVSGALVVIIGLSLFARRLRALLSVAAHGHDHHHDHRNTGHTHSPAAANGSDLTWRSLFALGVSGGILPCPSALVVMLAAISLNRVGYGLILIAVFSLGLASVLTAVGLAFVYGGKLLERVPSSGGLLRALPMVSAFVIVVLGVIICYQALGQSGLDFAALWSQTPQPTPLAEVIAILTLGLVFGFQHAFDPDHLAAVSTIVSERKSPFVSMLIGGVWGAGHTLSLLLAGIAVMLLRVNIDRFESPLEFCVALMLIGLGVNALYKLARGKHAHSHTHSHDGHIHSHSHIHVIKRAGVRPLIIGMVHGLAGSAALMLLVLSRITSPALGLVYIGLFGVGSIGGMMGMSSLLSLPASLTAEKFNRANLAVRALAGCFSLGFGLFMVYEIGFVGGLLR